MWPGHSHEAFDRTRFERVSFALPVNSFTGSPRRLACTCLPHSPARTDTSGQVILRCTLGQWFSAEQVPHLDAIIQIVPVDGIAPWFEVPMTSLLRCGI